MKRTQKQIQYIPEAECYRTDESELRAYFNYMENYVFFQFDDCKKFEKWKIERAGTNRKNKKIEPFQACDKEGFYSSEKMYRLQRLNGLKQHKPKNLFELAGYCASENQPTDFDFEY